MSRRVVVLRVREDDLRVVLSDAHDYADSLLEAANGHRGTIASARRRLAAVRRVRAALNRVAGVTAPSDAQRAIAEAVSVPVDELAPSTELRLPRTTRQIARDALRDAKARGLITGFALREGGRATIYVRDAAAPAFELKCYTKGTLDTLAMLAQIEAADAVRRGSDEG